MHYSYSDRHEPLKIILKEIAGRSKNLDEVESQLKRRKILYEDWPLAAGRELFVGTGTRGHSIIGCSVKKEGQQLVVYDV